MIKTKKPIEEIKKELPVITLSDNPEPIETEKIETRGRKKGGKNTPPINLENTKKIVSAGLKSPFRIAQSLTGYEGFNPDLVTDECIDLGVITLNNYSKNANDPKIAMIMFSLTYLSAIAIATGGYLYERNKRIKETKSDNPDTGAKRDGQDLSNKEDTSETK